MVFRTEIKINNAEDVNGFLGTSKKKFAGELGLDTIIVVDALKSFLYKRNKDGFTKMPEMSWNACDKEVTSRAEKNGINWGLFPIFCLYFK